MTNYDKIEIREQLTTENIYELLDLWGGNPEYTSFGIISDTICHNPIGVGSRKLYYYLNSNLFYCYTGCEEPSFDIFQLLIKIAKIQSGKIFDLNDAVRWIANYFNLTGTISEDIEEIGLEDWKYFSNHINDEKVQNSNPILKIYDKSILDRFNYNVKITPWLKEHINQEVIKNARIGYYAGGDAITIPHFNIEGNFIGLRGRALGQEEAELYGKYRPLKINKVLYSHPLGMNLYNLNNSKDNIRRMGTAIVFEGEKSILQYQSYFGFDNDISVACCGSSISLQQMKLLASVGAKNIIIAFDRQFQEIGDAEFKHLKNNLLKIKARYGNYVNISFIFDKNMITGYKDSPTDDGKETFLKLFKERIII